MAAKSKLVRVRYAPSPTGFFHIGGARTALFGYLFARHHKGVHILRIEDTDKERSTAEFEKNIIEGMNWLKLDYDEGPMADGTQKGDYGPYRQSERTDIYKNYIEQLLSASHAYYCFCSKEELESVRQSQMTGGSAPMYNGKCRTLAKDEAARRRDAGEAAVIRFKMPAKKVTFHDLIRGEITFDNGLLGDIVIAKSLTEPLFILSNCIDDELMKITHVIRGEDHLANTPKQIALGGALGFSRPEYGHLPLILNPDRSKMSKRFAATAVDEYRRDGYLPYAIINFLVLLGWHPTGNEEFFTLSQLIEQFEVSRVQKSGAVFNVEKLAAFNAYYIRQLDNETLLTMIEPLGLSEHVSMLKLQGVAPLSRAQMIKIVGHIKERMKKLSEFLEYADFFFKLPLYEPKMLIWKQMTDKAVVESLNVSKAVLEPISEAEFAIKGALEKAILPLTEAKGKGEVLWPLRVTLSGKEASPGPFEIMEILGKAETLKRINIAISKLA